MNWTIEFTRTAAKARDRLPQAIRKRVLRALLELANDPYAASNVKALQGVEGIACGSATTASSTRSKSIVW